MATQDSPDAATKILAAPEIAGRLPANAWPLELLYLGIRLHENGIAERQTSRDGYDPSHALEIVETARKMLDRLMVKAGLAGPNRELFLAFWERGLQEDVFGAVETGLAEKIKNDESGRETLLAILKHYLPDPGYASTNGLAFYGAAAFFLRLSQTAEIDHEHLLKDAFAQLLKATESHGDAVNS